VAVIPVVFQSAPSDFDVKVRKKGEAWLLARGIDTTKPLPPKTKLPAYWTSCIPDLRLAYRNVCAYMCIYIEEITGDATVEHFKPKSLYPKQIYEWDNYLLVCGTMNGRKSNFEDVLNPFLLAPNTFYLNLVDGRIFPSPSLTTLEQQAAQQTIDRLKLDNADARKLRLRYWKKFTTGKIAESELQELSPFAWLEAKRQGWL
jgi:uncharacterized protein (TIGR02646 family)